MQSPGISYKKQSRYYLSWVLCQCTLKAIKCMLERKEAHLIVYITGVWGGELKISDFPCFQMSENVYFNRQKVVDTVS